MPNTISADQPDSYFSRQNLIDVWDSVTFGHLTDTTLRDNLNQLRDIALNQLIHPYQTPPDVMWDIRLTVQLYLFFDALYFHDLLQPHQRPLCDRVITLYLDSRVADSDATARASYLSRAEWAKRSPSGLTSAYR